MSRHEAFPGKDYAFEAWTTRAKDSDILSTAAAVGARLKKAGAAEHVGPCPRCGGTDRFAVNIKERIFLCRGSGDGGDIIALVRHVKECSFVQACEIIVGEPPPGRTSQPVDPEIERERRDERRDQELQREVSEAEQVDEGIRAATALFDTGSPIRNTWVDDYLERRGIIFRDEEAINLRFVEALSYWGFASPEADEQVELGKFPAMLAAIRDVAGNIIGVHRTYLSDQQPSKLVPPGDRARNKAKKVYRRQSGGLIWLGPIKATAAIGEGIETPWSWYKLAIGPEDVAIASAVSLGNLCGGATGTVPHPKKPGRTIPNGEPDMARPGMILPEMVRGVILLGDGDSDPHETRAKLLVAGRRARNEGREASISMAPDRMDWNNVLLAQRGAAA